MSTQDKNWLQLPFDVKYLFSKYAKKAAHVAFENPEAKYWEVIIQDTPIKIANENQVRTPLLKPVFSPVNWGVDKTIGGYNPLVLALVGSAITGGLGGLGGWLAHKILPDYIDETSPRRLGIAGALAGLLPGAAMYAAKVPTHGWGGALTAPLGKKSAEESDPDYSGVQEALDLLANYTHIPNCTFYKQAVHSSAGLFLPEIDVQEWTDTMFRDPYLTVKEKAFSAGMPYTAGLAKNRRFVSPMDVARIAAGAGVGAASGSVVGSVASGFLGLTPKARKGVQNIGLLAGAIRSALNVFR